MNDEKFLRLAIKKAKDSARRKLFPAGSVVVTKNGNVLASAISSTWPKGNHHAESDAVDQAMEKVNRQLNDCTLYSSMEPCVMCITRAFWGGIKRIVFAIKKQKVKQEYFESKLSGEEIIDSFKENVEFKHFKGLEKEALIVVRKWEEMGGFDQ